MSNKLNQNEKINLSIATEEDMLALGAQLAGAIQDEAIIFLYGSLGAGKTTLTRGFLRQFGYTGKVKSPTYTLVEPYQFSTRSIFHFDLYRLHHPNELANIGIKDYFFPSAICLIEWPENGIGYLPQPDIACYIAFQDSGREVRFEACTPKGNAIIQQLKE